VESLILSLVRHFPGIVGIEHVLIVVFVFETGFEKVELFDSYDKLSPIISIFVSFCTELFDVFDDVLLS
jgi:hypothetical protein